MHHKLRMLIVLILWKVQLQHFNTSQFNSKRKLLQLDNFDCVYENIWCLQFEYFQIFQWDSIRFWKSVGLANLFRIDIVLSLVLSYRILSITRFHINTFNLWWLASPSICHIDKRCLSFLAHHFVYFFIELF